MLTSQIGFEQKQKGLNLVYYHYKVRFIDRTEIHCHAMQVRTQNTHIGGYLKPAYTSSLLKLFSKPSVGPNTFLNRNPRIGLFMYMYMYCKYK